MPLKLTLVAPVKPVPVITTEAPTAPLAGLRLLSDGAGAATVKGRPLLVPPGVATVTLPVVAPAGTVAVIWVLELTVNVAAVPLKLTLVAPVKPVPVITTEIPTVPLVGLSPAITGAGIVTVNSSPLLAPAGVAATTLPVVAPAGTVAVIWVLELTVNVAAVPLKLTLVVPVRLVPVMATEVPAGPLVGLRLLRVGSGADTVKGRPLLGPPGVVTTTLPVLAPGGTLVVIWVAEFTVNVAVMPLNVTPVAPVRLVPVMTTVVPTVPLAGLRLLRAGVGTLTVKGRPLLVPPGVVTVTLPVVAPAGTVAVIWVPELTVNVAAVPLKLTAVAPVRLVPVITTEVPAVPLVGLRLLSAGPATAPEMVKLVFEMSKK